MNQRAAMAVVFAVAFGCPAFAWSEVNVTLEDPSGHPTKGVIFVGQMEGYYCSERSHAYSLSQYMSGVRMHIEEVVMAFGQCKPDTRHVMGVFPEKEKFPVVYVKMLENLAKSSYLVPGLLVDFKIHEARVNRDD